jgi:hypothetical protein
MFLFTLLQVLESAVTCGFCGRSDVLHTVAVVRGPRGGGTTQLSSPCPEFVATVMTLTHLKKVLKSRPCANFPVECGINGCEETIWKYNFRAHVKSSHPGYAIPLLPASSAFSGEDGRPGLRLPSRLTSVLDFGPNKEMGCGLLRSSLWSEIGTESGNILGSNKQALVGFDETAQVSAKRIKPNL